ncbi:MAG: hypothetical protein KAS21_11425, partial [Candidatus Aminicenantes bacterium]|nr:hypothetical protein [Candidatus Aminicenantes bacterium]
MATTLIIIAATSVVLYVVSTILIYDYLSKSGEKVSFLWIRLFMIKNASRYKKLTREKTGKTGYLYYIWIASNKSGIDLLHTPCFQIPEFVKLV